MIDFGYPPRTEWVTFATPGLPCIRLRLPVQSKIIVSMNYLKTLLVILSDL